MILVVVLAAIFVPIFFALASSGGPLAPLWSKLNPLAFASIDLTLKGEGIAPGQFNDPRTVAVDREGGFYAGDFNTGRVQAFDAQGNFRWVANLGDEVIIESMDVSPTGILFIAAQGEIRRFQASDGRELDPLPKPDPQSYYYEDLAFGPDGRLAVIANGEDLYIFNPDLQLVISVPEAISSITQDSELDSDVAMDGMGNIYLLGTFNYKVLRYTPDGRYVNQFGGDTVDEAPGKFRAPGEIAVDNQGRVYVSDIFGIQVFDGDGQYINRFDLVQYAFGMDFDLENRMYIASNEPQVVRLVLRK
jgi:DNA-binding beta-propeller fold protein YncE